MDIIRKNFLEENKGKNIRIIFGNGFQLRGRLIKYDETHMLIETSAYESGPIVVPFTAVNAYVPSK